VAIEEAGATSLLAKARVIVKWHRRAKKVLRISVGGTKSGFTLATVAV
jgi:hypothetical protein